MTNNTKNFLSNKSEVSNGINGKIVKTCYLQSEKAYLTVVILNNEVIEEHLNHYKNDAKSCHFLMMIK